MRLSGSFLIPDSLLKECKPREVVGYKHGLPDNICLDVCPHGGTDQQRGRLAVGLRNYGSSDVEVVSAVITLAGKTFTYGQFTVRAGLALRLADISLDEWRAGLRDGVNHRRWHI